jgi:hypothetical protein
MSRRIIIWLDRSLFYITFAGKHQSLTVIIAGMLAGKRKK